MKKIITLSFLLLLGSQILANPAQQFISALAKPAAFVGATATLYALYNKLSKPTEKDVLWKEYCNCVEKIKKTDWNDCQKIFDDFKKANERHYDDLHKRNIQIAADRVRVAENNLYLDFNTCKDKESDACKEKYEHWITIYAKHMSMTKHLEELAHKAAIKSS